MLAKQGSSREGGDKGQEGDKGERGDELHGEVNFISLFVAYSRILFLRRDGWENCTVLVLEREEVNKGKEVEDVHCEEVEDVHGEEIEDVHVKEGDKGEEVCKEVYVLHAFYGKLHGRFHRREEVDQAENANQCGSKSALSFAVKTIETITVHSEVYFPFFCVANLGILRKFLLEELVRNRPGSKLFSDQGLRGFQFFGQGLFP